MTTDKKQAGITDIYTKLFRNQKDKAITLLELGTLDGGGLEWFKDYFKNGKIIGFDHRERSYPVEVGRQEDSMRIRDLGEKYKEFDIIIDDCSHYGTYTQISLDFLWKYLKSGGYFIIEDWEASFRMGEWRGVNDVVADLVRNFDRWKIAEMNIYNNLVVIKKV